MLRIMTAFRIGLALCVLIGGGEGLLSDVPPPPVIRKPEALRSAPDPANEEGEFRSLILLATRSEQVEAIEVFLRRYPEGRFADTARALWLRLKGDDASAEERRAWMADWLAAKPEDPAVLNFAAQASMRANDGAAARRLALRALEHVAGDRKERSIALATLAELDLGQGRPQAALARLDEAIRLEASPALLRAFDLSGRERWSRDLGAAPALKLLRARALLASGAAAAAGAELWAAARASQTDGLAALRSALAGAGVEPLPAAPRELAVPPPLAPPLPITDLEGRPRSLDDFSGKVVLVNFWATWCVPCQYELPELQRLYGRLKDDGLVVLAVNMDDPSELDDPSDWFAERGLSLPLYRHTPAAERSYRLISLPLLALIDRDGRLRLRRSGYVAGAEDELERQVRALLQGRGEGLGMVWEELRDRIEIEALYAVPAADATDTVFHDVDGDAEPELVVSTHDGIAAYGRDGREVWNRTLPEAGGALEAGPTLLVGGGALRLVAGNGDPIPLDPGFNPGFSRPMLFAAFGAGAAASFFYAPGLIGFDAAGRVRWRQEGIEAVAALARVGAKLVVADGEQRWHRLAPEDGAIEASGAIGFAPTVLAGQAAPEPLWFAGGSSDDRLLRYPEGAVDLAAASAAGGCGPLVAVVSESERLLLFDQRGDAIWRGAFPEPPLRVALAARGRGLDLAVVGAEGSLFRLRIGSVSTCS